MSQVLLKIKIDIPTLQQELDQAVSEIRGKLSKFGIFKFELDDKNAKASISELEKHISSLKALLQEKVEMNADLTSITVIEDRLKVAESALKGLKTEAEKPVVIKPVPIDPAYLQHEQILKQLKTDILDVALTEDKLSQSIVDFIKYNNLSEKEIKELISTLEQQKNSLAINSTAYKEHQAAIQSLTQAQAKLILEQKQFPPNARQISGAASQMNMAIGQFGFLLGDLDMMFVSTRIGIMSIANNFPMVAQALIYVQNEVKRTGESFKSALINSIMGSGGVLLAINALMFLLNVLPRLFGDTTDKIKEQKKAVDDLKDSMEKMTKASLEAALAPLEVERQSLLSKQKAKTKASDSVETLANPDAIDLYIAESKLSDEEGKRLEDLNKITKAYKDQLYNLGEIGNLERELRFNQESLLRVNKENLQEYSKYGKTVEDVKQKFRELIKLDDDQLKKQKELGESSSKQIQQLAKDIAQAKIGAMKSGKEKDLAELDEWLSEEREKHTKNKQWLTLLEGSYQLKRQIILEKYAEEDKKKLGEVTKTKEELLRKSELIDAEEIKDEYEKQQTKLEINYWYDRQAVYSKISELKAKNKLNDAEKIELENHYQELTNLNKKYLSDGRDLAKKKADKDEQERDKEEEYFKSLNQRTLSLKQISLSEELKLIEKQRDLELDLHGKTEEQKFRISEYYDLLRQKKIEDSLEKEKREYEKFFSGVVNVFERAFSYEREISDAEVELNKLQYEKELQTLKESLDKGEINRNEYLLRTRLATEENNRYLTRLEEERMTDSERLAKEAQKFLLDLLKDYLVKYAAQKLAEATIHGATEAEKTAATETGVFARIGLMALEVVKSLALGAAKILTAIADGIAYLFATLGPFALVAIPAMVGGTIAVWNGIKSVLGFRKAGYTGDGDPDDPAGIVHKREYVFESELVDKEPEQYALLHRMLRSGMTLTDIFMSVRRITNPITEAPMALAGINLSMPSIIQNRQTEESNAIKRLLINVDDRLKRIEETGIKAEVEVYGKSEISNEHIYMGFKKRERLENKRKADDEQ